MLPGKNADSAQPRKNLHMIAPAAFCVAAVQADIIPQTATQLHRYQLGRVMALRTMLLGIWHATYPTNKIDLVFCENHAPSLEMTMRDACEKL